MRPLHRRGGLFAAVLVLSFGSPAQAVMVTNVTTGQLLFFDDFEGGGANVSHAPYLDTSGDYDPIARVGTWSVVEGTVPGMIQVTDSLLAPDPGAAQGGNYLRINRAPYPSNFNCVTGNLLEPQDLSGHRGQQIHWEMMVNVAPGVGVPAIFSLFDQGSIFAQVVADTTAGKILASRSVGGNQDTGLRFVPGQWTEMALDYVIGADSFSMTVGGNRAASLSLYSGTGSGVAQIRLAGNPGGGTYFDQAVPEPGALALVGVGSLCLAACGWRKWRRWCLKSS